MNDMKCLACGETAENSRIQFDYDGSPFWECDLCGECMDAAEIREKVKELDGWSKLGAWLEQYPGKVDLPSAEEIDEEEQELGVPAAAPAAPAPEKAPVWTVLCVRAQVPANFTGSQMTDYISGFLVYQLGGLELDAGWIGYSEHGRTVWNVRTAGDVTAKHLAAFDDSILWHKVGIGPIVWPVDRPNLLKHMREEEAREKAGAKTEETQDDWVYLTVAIMKSYLSHPPRNVQELYDCLASMRMVPISPSHFVQLPSGDSSIDYYEVRTAEIPNESRLEGLRRGGSVKSYRHKGVSYDLFWKPARPESEWTYLRVHCTQAVMEDGGPTPAGIQKSATSMRGLLLDPGYCVPLTTPTGTKKQYEVRTRSAIDIELLRDGGTVTSYRRGDTTYDMSGNPVAWTPPPAPAEPAKPKEKLPTFGFATPADERGWNYLRFEFVRAGSLDEVTVGWVAGRSSLTGLSLDPNHLAFVSEDRGIGLYEVRTKDLLTGERLFTLKNGGTVVGIRRDGVSYDLNGKALPSANPPVVPNGPETLKATKAEGRGWNHIHVRLSTAHLPGDKVRDSILRCKLLEGLDIDKGFLQVLKSNPPGYGNYVVRTRDDIDNVRLDAFGRSGVVKDVQFFTPEGHPAGVTIRKTWHDGTAVGSATPVVTAKEEVKEQAPRWFTYVTLRLNPLLVAGPTAWGADRIKKATGCPGQPSMRTAVDGLWTFRIDGVHWPTLDKEIVSYFHFQAEANGGAT